jgi:hypothetical protein
MGLASRETGQIPRNLNTTQAGGRQRNMPPMRRGQEFGSPHGRRREIKEGLEFVMGHDAELLKRLEDA